MKRFVVPFLALFALTAPLTAHAGKWIQKEIFWSKGGAVTGGQPGSVALGSAVGVHDTLYAPSPFKTSGSIDTTGKFSLDNADIWRLGHAGAASVSDSVIVGYLIFVQDSTGAPLNTVTSLAVSIDGRPGGFRLSSTDTLSRGWVVVDSLVLGYINAQTSTRGSAILTVPIRAVLAPGFYRTADAENNNNINYRIMAFEDLRARVVSVTGIMTGSLRAFIRYWDSDPAGAVP